jgi:hypothetical protein
VPVAIVVLVLVSIAGCNQMLGTSQARHGACEPDAPFAHIAPVGGLDGDLGVQSAQLSRDELTIVFSRLTISGTVDAPTSRYGDLYLAHREHLDDDFHDVVPLDGLNTNADELGAALSDDLHMLYFARGGPSLPHQIFAASLPSPMMPAGEAVSMALGDTGESELEPYITSSAIYFSARRADGSASLFTAAGQRTSFGPAQRLQSLETQASAAAYGNPVVSSDELTIYFSAPSDHASVPDIWTASRPAFDRPFDAPRAIAELDTISGERPAWISEDSCRLYFVTNRTGTGYRVWIASRAAP